MVLCWCKLYVRPQGIKKTNSASRMKTKRRHWTVSNTKFSKLPT